MSEKKVPELRFKGYAEDWEQRKVNSISGKTYGGGTPKTKTAEYWQGDFPWIQSSDLKIDELNKVNPQKFITEEAIKNSAAKAIPGNSIAIVTRVGVGKLAYLKYPYSTSQDFLSLSVLTVDPLFGVYGLYKLIKKELNNIQGTSIKGMTKSDLLNKKLYIPFTLEEQKQIGTFLKTLDNTIALHQDKLEKLKQLKKGYLQVMFPQNGETLPRLRFANFSADWEQHKFKDFLKVKSGRDYKHLGLGKIPVYGTGGYMLSVDDKLSDQDAIGIGRKGTIDKPQYLIAPFWTVDTLFFMTPQSNFDLFFLYSLTQKINWKKLDESTGVPSLSKSVIENVQQNIPSHQEQIKIGELFKQLDNTISLQQEKIINLQNIKKYYLQKLFV